MVVAQLTRTVSAQAQSMRPRDTLEYGEKHEAVLKDTATRNKDTGSQLAPMLYECGHGEMGGRLQRYLGPCPRDL